MEQHNIIYRLGVSGLHCRSSVELVNLKVTALAGVHAASIGPDNVLTVFADADAVAPSDIVRTLVDAGVLPIGAVSVAQLDEPAEGPNALAEVTADVELETAVAPQADGSEPGVIDFVEPVVELTPIAPEPEVAPEPLAAPLSEDVVVPALADVEESLKADIETPREAPSPRAALVQRIKVVVADDYYPNRIEVIPGVPVDIEFSEGHGCLARVVFDEFEIEEDLTNGGATVRLPGLTPGTHEFSCGMRMVHGTVVAAI